MLTSCSDASLMLSVSSECVSPDKRLHGWHRNVVRLRLVRHLAQAGLVRVIEFFGLPIAQAKLCNGRERHGRTGGAGQCNGDVSRSTSLKFCAPDFSVKHLFASCSFCQW